MRFLSTLVKAVCLTIALGAPTAAFANVSTPSTIPPAEAPVEAPKTCITLKEVTDTLVANNPGIEIIAVDGVKNTVTFDIASYPTSLLVGFDENGCFLAMVEIPKGPKVGA